ncbi:MAG TPA: hypothetical protein VN258_09550 [Mobilitalea sp.]|nr:hypothetical protein [Mobilitalea sp.]
MFLNGTYIGDINGGFTRAKFDITPYASHNTENYLAVLIIKNTDSGTLDLTKLNITLKTEVANSSEKAVTAFLCGVIRGRKDLLFEKEVQLKANEICDVEIGPLVMKDPELWWPNGYGEQPLYNMTVTASVNGEPSDKKEFQFGARELTYTLEERDQTDRNGYQNGNNLTILCNGVRVIIRGGNWGLEDIHLNVDAEGYDDKMRLHKYENFNIIRNWGGQVNDGELYKACDKYGILIWDDFFFPGCWLHIPKDSDMFLANVVDKIKQYRSHPCLALYCGANETHPEVEEIEKGMRKYVKTLDGTRHYIPNSAQAPVAEDGPHKAMLPEFYFTNTLPGIMNSERGMPNIPVAETMRMIFPEDKLWPHNDMWALHDFALRWNVDGGGYLKKLEDYGEYDTFDEMIRRAQLQSYELHKAMFEGSIASRSNGLMMWMSNPVWPSLVWQSYDYFHDVNGGYYGLKTACQPINLIWNPANDRMCCRYSMRIITFLLCRVKQRVLTWNSRKRTCLKELLG